MPAGYKFHQSTYKSPPGPEVPEIGYKYTEAKNEAHLTAWRYALRDMLLKARAQNINFPEEITLSTDLDMTAFQGSYDYVLREGLREYGHILSAAPDSATLFYSAYNPEDIKEIYSTDRIIYNGDMPSDGKAFTDFGPKTIKMELVIGVLEDNVLTKEVRGIYELPVDGYTPDAYVAGHENPLHQKPTKSCPFICPNEDKYEEE